MPFVLDHDLDVNAPADVVWEVLTDFPRYKDWNPFVLECATTLKPGEAIRMQVNLTGAPQAVNEVIEEHVPGKRFAYHMKPIALGALSSQRSHDVEAGGAARSRYRSHFELKGWLSPLVLALYRKNLETAFASMSGAVKKRAEDLWATRQRKSA